MECSAMSLRLPPQVLAAATKRKDASLIACQCEPITGTSGAATGSVTRIFGKVQCGVDELSFRLIRKEVQPAVAARQVEALDPRHWAYWRREPLAYASGLLPAGPDFMAPHC